jgi:hypothetical protein
MTINGYIEKSSHDETYDESNAQASKPRPRRRALISWRLESGASSKVLPTGHEGL